MLLGALASPPDAHWHLESDDRLIAPPDRADTPWPVTTPMLATPAWRAPRLFGQDASDTREGLVDLPEPVSGPFSVELWISDHVNHPVGAMLAGIGPDGAARWTLGYFSELGNGKFDRGAALRFGPIEARPGAGDTALAPWRSYLHHLVGTFDGARWRLYHNGALVREAAGPAAAFVRVHLAGYLAAERYMRLPDLVRDAWVRGHAMSPAEVAAAFAARKAEIEQATRGAQPGLRFTAGPYLTPPGDTEQGILWETNSPASGSIAWGETAAFGQRADFTTPDRLHRLTLPQLKPDTAYFYRITARAADGTSLESGTLSFRTMPPAGAPLVFAATGDTQERPFVNFRLAQEIWRQRPHFLLIAGDLIGGEENERRWHWTDEYFVGLGALVARVPVLAARGNGDVDMIDAATDRRVFSNFDRYHNQPDLDRSGRHRGYYSRRIGDVEFFMLDGNLALRERQEPGFRARQRAWFENALRASTARWKIAVHHQVAWSSDDDDYGDSYTGPTTSGDPDIRKDFVDLHERYGVDLVLSGHIHSYERSWPLLGGRPACGGVTYLQLGGGGGDHERPGPVHQPFAAAHHDGFHYGLFRVWNDALSFQLFDAEGRLRDSMDLVPRAEAARRCTAGDVTKLQPNWSIPELPLNRR